MKYNLEIEFKDNVAVPKYRQIIDAIHQNIEDGQLKKGDKIPSLNMLCNQYGLSQDTVLMAYNELKTKGIITSQVGKGYFIQKEVAGNKHNVLLLFDTLSAYKQSLYESFKETLQTGGSEQIFFHHHNIKMFQTIIDDAIGNYSAYVIMPVHHPDAKDAISKLPAKKVFILDQGRNEYQSLYPFVCQDFENNIYHILVENALLVRKYRRLILVIRNQQAHFKYISNGFKRFCSEHGIKAELVSNIKSFIIKKIDAFVVVDDRDLEFIVRYSMEKNFELGTDLGVVSYNEAPLKGIVANGITTISTDFGQMGKSMADMILKRKRLSIDNPFLMIKRSSF